MLDISLRPVKDRIFDPLSNTLPHTLSPHVITALGFCCGLVGCACASRGLIIPSVIFWVLNRALDCVDGSFARLSGQQSDMGGFWDLLADFIIYSLVPICCALGNMSGYDGPVRANGSGTFVSVMLLEASFHINNFVLFFIAAVTEKAKAQKPATKQDDVAKQLTSLSMKPALIEGFESGVFFTLMLMFPSYLSWLSSCMLALVLVGTTQRVYWLAHVL